MLIVVIYNEFINETEMKMKLVNEKEIIVRLIKFSS